MANWRSVPMSFLLTRLTAFTPANVMMSPFFSGAVVAVTVMLMPVWLAPFTVGSAP